MTDYSRLEQDLGYTFINKSLLETAFTHTTYVFETGRGHWESNQRLEFIGDAVLDVVVGQMIYELKPQADEGYLSKMRSVSVCEKSFAEVARKLHLGDYLCKIAGWILLKSWKLHIQNFIWEISYAKSQGGSC